MELEDAEAVAVHRVIKEACEVFLQANPTYSEANLRRLTEMIYARTLILDELIETDDPRLAP